MEETMISFQVAKLAKEKGFDCLVSNCYLEDGELCGTYELMDEEDSAFIDVMDGNELENHNHSDFDRYSAPTQSLLQKWLRDVFNIHIITSINSDMKSYTSKIIYIDQNNEIHYIINSKYNNYEDALEVALEKSLKLLPDKK